MQRQFHPFHLVSPSPWPLCTSVAIFSLVLSGVLSFHGFEWGWNLFFLSLLNLIISMSLWFRDIISEGTYLGNHTFVVQRGINLGVGLFIVSEALFFLAFFWTFFHSALSPNIELGGQWPPMGINGINPFELPLLNTIILLSSGVTVTYSHHSLIQGNRKGSLNGLLYTVLLAGIFTILQGVEYTVSSFTISDGVYSSCFYFGTGFHGLIHVALFIYMYIFLFKLYSSSAALLHTEAYKDIDNSKNNYKNKLLISHPKNGDYFLDRNFIEWFVGFTDGEGNFHIRLTDLNNNTFKSVQFTFQIGLHKDDLKVLEYIMYTLKCGHISKYENRVNFFVNDKDSLLNIIIPIFDFVNLNSSKYHHYLLFNKAVFLLKNKEHLLDEGKLTIIKCKKEMQNISGKWVPDSIYNKINITKYWLAGFIDGKGTFSTSRSVPRFKLENHMKELELYNKIKAFIGIDKLIYSLERVDKINSNPTIILEINKIKDIKNKLIPLMYDKNNLLLKTLKSDDFLLWLNLIEIYYKGYHTRLEGKYLVDCIKSHMNKYRISTNNLKNLIPISEIENLLSKLYLLESPYEIKEGVRYYRGTNKLVSDSNQIVCIDDNNCSTVYNSISVAAKNLNISRKKIKECLTTGEKYKGYFFVLK